MMLRAMLAMIMFSMFMMVTMSRNILEQMMKLQQDFKMQMKKQEQVAIVINRINSINCIKLPAIIIKP